MDGESNFGAVLDLEYYNALTGERLAHCNVRTGMNTHSRVREVLEQTQGSRWGPVMVPPCNIRVVSHLPQSSAYMLIVPAANPNTNPAPAGHAAQPENSVLNKPVAILRLPTLCANRLRKAGVRTVLELCQLSYDDLRRGKIRLIGVSGLRHIVEALAKHKLSLADYVEPT